VAEQLGQPLMPWQRLVADVGGEVDPLTGLPAYRDVVVTVPRQSGKTTLILSWMIQRALGWGSAQKIVYSAQTGNDARKKLVEDWVPILEPRKARIGVRRILKGMGNESVEFRNGSRAVLMASGDDAGHGKTVHFAVKDEFFADFDDRRDQALGPAMITVADAQKLTASTAGTDASVPLNALVARGRAAVLSGETSGIAYFEWSAPDDADPDDPEVWWSCMPALGLTMTEDAVRHERDVTFAGKPGEFRRAYLNIATKSDERVIPAAAWDLVNDPGHKIAGSPQVFAVDVNPERSTATIVAFGGDVLEVVDHRPGVGWLVDRVLELNEKWHPMWAADASPTSPTASLLTPIEAAGCKVEKVNLSVASAALFDAVVDRKVSIRRHPALDDAVAGAAKRPAGDGWCWSRLRSTVDISPLVAVTLARWAALATVPVPTPGFVSLDDFLEDDE
jgi:hypothetical protein